MLLFQSFIAGWPHCISDVERGVGVLCLLGVFSFFSADTATLSTGRLCFHIKYFIIHEYNEKFECVYVFINVYVIRNNPPD